MANRANIEAVFYLSEDVKNPKNNGIKSRFTPLHKFKNIDYLMSGVHYYSDDLYHYPGEILPVRILLVGWEEEKNKINVGDEFDVQELYNLIGHGKVTKIL